MLIVDLDMDTFVFQWICVYEDDEVSVILLILILLDIMV